MRKLLLGTTALAAAATLSANAIADISISGYYEWKYQSRSSNITTNDGTTFANDSEITFGKPSINEGNINTFDESYIFINSSIFVIEFI